MNKGFPEYAHLTDDELSAEFEAVLARDPWPLDWPYGHPGRRLRCEAEIRAGRLTLEQARASLNGRGFRVS